MWKPLESVLSGTRFWGWQFEKLEARKHERQHDLSTDLPDYVVMVDSLIPLYCSRKVVVKFQF